MTEASQFRTSGPAGRIVRFLRDECGAARHDRLFLMVGGGIVGALVLFMWAADTLDAGGDGAAAAPGAAAPVERKTVSSGPQRAPDPPPSEDAEGGGVFVAADYSESLIDVPDREAQLLNDEITRIRAAEAAAAAAEAEAATDAAAAAAAAETPGG